MQQELPFEFPSLEVKAISPFRELGAYEALWDRPKMSFKKISEMHKEVPGSLPSDFVDKGQALKYAQRVCDLLDKAGVKEFGVRINGAGEYPQKLRDADHPLQLFYYQGWWDLTSTRMVSVVGTRNPSRDGVELARDFVKNLVADDFTIVSGLALGIDTVAHTTAIEGNGQTVGVIGTPLSETYPKINRNLQAKIACDFLLISQIPVWHYGQQDYRWNRKFFPERNITMSALTEATIIVEAGETSGTLIQARAALKQQRKLFILEHCFQNPKLAWPEEFVNKGAHRVANYEDLRCLLA